MAQQIADVKAPVAGRWRVALLALSLTLLVVGVAGCGLAQTSPHTTTTPSTDPAPMASPTQTAVVVDGVRFKTITDPTFGFRVDIPANMVQNGSQPDPADGGGVTTWNGYFPTAQDTLALTIVTATTGLPAQSCNTGTPITLGSGLPGYEQDIFAQPLPSPQPNSGGVVSSRVLATVVANGVYVAIRLDGLPPDATFMQRYGALWQHILASFTPGSFVNPHNPCAG